MTDLNGNNQGYFTLNDWKTALMFLPVQHPLCSTEERADQILVQLLQKGVIEQFEPGKYRPKEGGEGGGA